MEKPANVFEGKLEAKGLKIAIACSRFNNFFVEKLLEGACDAIVRHGGSMDNVDVAWCPGSYELPFVASRFLAAGITDERRMLYYFHYVRAGMTTVLRLWLEDGCRETPEEIASVLRNSIVRGEERNHVQRDETL